MNFHRYCFWLAGILATIFLGDILYAKAQMLSGNSIPVHLSGTIQFVFLLAACAFFVVGAIDLEQAEKVDKKPE